MPTISEEAITYFRDQIGGFGSIAEDERDRLVGLVRTKAASLEVQLAAGHTTLGLALPHIRVQLASESAISGLVLTADARERLIETAWRVVHLLLGAA